MLKKTFVTIGKALIYTILGLCYIVILFSLLLGAGQFVADLISAKNVFGVITSYIFIWVFFMYLLNRSGRESFEGVEPFWFSIPLALIYAGVATAIIFSIQSLGLMFLGINLVLYLIIIALISRWQQNKMPNHPAMSKTEALNNKVLFVIVIAGIMQGFFAFGLYKLNVFVS